MERRKRITFALVLILAMLLQTAAVFGADSVEALTQALDYSSRDNWAYFAQGEDKDVDVFLICPTVDTRSYANSLDLNDKLKGRFVNALDMEKGIYEDVGRMYSPYYRQMSIGAYQLPEEEQQQAFENAYLDIAAAFSWYLENENGGRPLILAGFSQGSQMCIELLKDFYGEGEEAEALRKKLVAVYALGWAVTEEDIKAYPQIVPAKGETDTGSVICFDCEAEGVSGTFIIPSDSKSYSINPLNWKTDSTKGDKSLNKGAVMGTGEEPIEGLCGAYIGERGQLVVTDVTPADYPPVLDIFPKGSYHIYDYMFFFGNLKENVADRKECYFTGLPFKDVKRDAWYRDAVEYSYERGVIEGTSPSKFSPDGRLTGSQLLIMTERRYGSEASDAVASLAEADKNTPISREKTVEMLCKLGKKLGADMAVGENTNILSYSDAFDISEGYGASMQWAVGSGLIEGSNGRLNPKGSLSRAQAVTMLMRFDGIVRAAQPLSLWTEGSKASQALIDYVEAVTDENCKCFIPVEDRIAVFDLDGTLFCETDPNYFDYTLLKYRVLEDPSYIDKASDFEKEVANKIKEQNETGKSLPGLEVDHGKAVASAFSGMTVEEFNAYIQEFKKLPMPSYEGMLRGEGFYRPMIQVVNYLKDNGFTVYVVSGTDRLIVRGIVDDSILELPNRQLIGSDETIISSGQGDTPGLDYVFKDGEELILGGEFIIKNLKMNKVSVIMQEIGQQPVLSFGNSTGDSSMAEYVTSGNKYRSLAFMLCCDDTERENGNVSKADKMKALCEEFDWVPVSMKDDWTTIYGEGVTYTGK